MTTLSIWSVYDHPSDFPSSVVARRWVVSGPLTMATDDVIVAGTLDLLRASLPDGLARIERSPEDDPTIVESWL